MRKAKRIKVWFVVAEDSDWGEPTNAVIFARNKETALKIARESVFSKNQEELTITQEKLDGEGWLLCDGDGPIGTDN